MLLFMKGKHYSLFLWSSSFLLLKADHGILNLEKNFEIILSNSLILQIIEQRQQNENTTVPQLIIGKGNINTLLSCGLFSTFCYL